MKETMQKLGGTVSKVDSAVFYWLDDLYKVTGVLACHVDDFMWGGSDMFSTVVIPKLKAAFQVGREEHNSFSYVGIELHSLQYKKICTFKSCRQKGSDATLVPKTIPRSQISSERLFCPN